MASVAIARRVFFRMKHILFLIGAPHANFAGMFGLVRMLGLGGSVESPAVSRSRRHHYVPIASIGLETVSGRRLAILSFKN